MADSKPDGDDRLLDGGRLVVGAILAPLAGVAGNHDALPMGITIAACGIGALLINQVWCDRTPFEPALEAAP
jgi:hypothetical protein